MKVNEFNKKIIKYFQQIATINLLLAIIFTSIYHYSNKYESIEQGFFNNESYYLLRNKLTKEEIKNDCSYIRKNKLLKKIEEYSCLNSYLFLKEILPIALKNIYINENNDFFLNDISMFEVGKDELLKVYGLIKYAERVYDYMEIKKQHFFVDYVEKNPNNNQLLNNVVQQYNNKNPKLQNDVIYKYYSEYKNKSKVKSSTEKNILNYKYIKEGDELELYNYTEYLEKDIPYSDTSGDLELYELLIKLPIFSIIILFLLKIFKITSIGIYKLTNKAIIKYTKKNVQLSLIIIVPSIAIIILLILIQLV
jgi:hypothetical protein